ncbi:antibiotic biosynthesis monooxygenase family protein, partial [Kitasatospora sp. LaBMicrA B282]|uniref:antibiotic biosynthesis monooxygenase family protein n=1 Tax=Kitasatospora sp. LaBMicrA B282 TaxID=3420949 RepID=UPI003D109AF8
MTTLSDRPDPTLANSRLRVVLLLDVHDGQEANFLDAYEQIRHQVAGVPGHISDQLCQSLGNSSQWLITSEWESAEPFLSWVESAAHRKVVEPLHACVSDTRSLRFVIARETPEPGTAAAPPPPRPPRPPLPRAPA